MQKSEHEVKLPYRVHIDGLRGIAVLAVVFYHAQLLAATGGRVGVDVFFVISGFLIAARIQRDVRSGTFSLRGFWERRVRRIIPALFVVVVTVLVAGCFLLLYPADHQLLGGAAIAQSVFASNILFMFSGNYLDQPSLYSPLLHTWSISVEEQFYLLFPLIVMLCGWIVRRTPRDGQPVRTHLLPATIGVLGLVSLLLNVWFVNIAPTAILHIGFEHFGWSWSTSYASAGFYLLSSRVWELALGIVLALYAVKVRSALCAEALSLLGLLAIIVSIFLYTDATPFPGLAAILPVAGTAVFIAANEERRTRVGVILSYPTLVWVGLISYSLYLWHWPLLVFARTVSVGELPVPSRLGLVGAAVAIAWLSYTFVETPFRRTRGALTRNMTLALGTLALGMMLLFGILFERSSPRIEQLMPQSARELLQASDNIEYFVDHCFSLGVEGVDEKRYTNECSVGSQGTHGEPVFALWGDSEAAALTPLFDKLGEQFGVRGVVFSSGSCSGNYAKGPAAYYQECSQTERFEQFALQSIENQHIKDIFLEADWSVHRSGPQEHPQVSLIGEAHTPSLADEWDLALLVKRLLDAGRRVYIIKQIPNQPGFTIRAAFYDAMYPARVVESRATLISTAPASARADAVLGTIGQQPNVAIIDPARILCKKDATCTMTQHATLLYLDDHHLSAAGALALEPLLLGIFGHMQSLHR